MTEMYQIKMERHCLQKMKVMKKNKCKLHLRQAPNQRSVTKRRRSHNNSKQMRMKMLISYLIRPFKEPAYNHQLTKLATQDTLQLKMFLLLNRKA